MSQPKWFLSFVTKIKKQGKQYHVGHFLLIAVLQLQRYLQPMEDHLMQTYESENVHSNSPTAVCSI